MVVRRIHYSGYERALGALSGAGFVHFEKGPLAPYIRNRIIQQYVVVYLLEGGGAYSDPINGEKDVRAGDSILLFPGLAHTYHRSDPALPWSEAFLVLEGELFSDLEKAGEIRRSMPILHGGLSPSGVTLLNELVREYMTAGPGEEAIYCARAFLVLARLLAAHRRHEQGPIEHSFVERACAQLNTVCEEASDLGLVAKGFGMSERNFRRRFTEQVGVAPARYRLLQRVAAAKTMLSENRLSLSAISERLGYFDTAAFTKQFKQITGASPAQFRDTQVLGTKPHQRRPQKC